MKFAFDERKVDLLKENYDLFHPSIDQIKILYHMASKLSEIIGCQELICRNILIQSYINVQKRQRIFHFSVEQEMPQIRLKYAEAVYLEIEQSLIDLLTDMDQEDLLKDELHNLFDVYFSKFATR